MTIETATFISQLNASYPASADKEREGDDHLRLIKTTIKNTFPNVAGVVSANASELDIWRVGGTISGSLTVSGGISASGSLTAASIKLETTSSASPVSAGRAMFDTTDNVIRVGDSATTVTIPQKTTKDWSVHHLSQAYSHSSNQTIFLNFSRGTVDYGDSVSLASSWVLPAGHYEIDLQLTAYGTYTESNTYGARFAARIHSGDFTKDYQNYEEGRFKTNTFTLTNRVRITDYSNSVSWTLKCGWQSIYYNISGISVESEKSRLIIRRLES